MKTYIGTKLIKAKSLNLGEYNILKGWIMPSNEDPLREGYLVKYNDDYISWSPKKEFEESYREIKTLNDIKIKELIKTNWEDFPAHQQRVITEVTELDIKIEKLDNFILTSYIFKSLEKDEQLLFINQIQSMQYYFGILVERINKFK